MNEVVIAQPIQKVAPQSVGPSAALIVALEGEIGQKAATLAWRSHNTVKEWDAWFKAMREAEQAGSGGSSVIRLLRNPPSGDDILQAAIASGEAMLADPLFQKLSVELTPFVGTATTAQVKCEIGKLLAAFPTKDNLIAFTALLVEEIISVQPSWLALAMACRELRRNCKFRPSIAEVLEALSEVDWYACRSAKIVRMPKYVTALQKHLAEAERLRPPKPPKPTPLQQALADCGCYVCPDQEGHSVTDGAKRLAGPFTTKTEAWSWLEEHAVALCDNLSPL